MWGELSFFVGGRTVHSPMSCMCARGFWGLRGGEACIRREEGRGRGSGTQKFVHQKWPKSMFPSVNFIFFLHMKSGWGPQEGGGGSLLLRLSAILIHPSGGRCSICYEACTSRALAKPSDMYKGA
jgi:hypothetical protein